MHKFGWLPDGAHDEPYIYPNVWARETTSGPDRLVAGAAHNQVGLLHELSSVMKEPFMLLYLLTLSRTGAEPGRYQSLNLLNQDELTGFLNRHKDYLELDGRHNLWIRSEVEGDMLIYDRHNVIYAYGNIPSYIWVLDQAGLTEQENLRFPDPHTHHYNAVFDAQETALLQEMDWHISALRPGDENPD